MIHKKLVTAENGKGSKIREGADLKAYWDSPLWDNIGKKFIRSEKSSSECALPELVSKSS